MCTLMSKLIQKSDSAYSKQDISIIFLHKEVKFKIYFQSKNRTTGLLLFFTNVDRDFGTLGIEIAKIRLQIRISHNRIRLYANLDKLSCLISLKNYQQACFFGDPVHELFLHPIYRRLLVNSCVTQQLHGSNIHIHVQGNLFAIHFVVFELLGKYVYNLISQHNQN